LEDLKVVKQRLRADALDAIVANCSAHALKAQSPRVDGLLKLHCRLLYPTDP
jgi:hypothetical protein